MVDPAQAAVGFAMVELDRFALGLQEYVYGLVPPTAVGLPPIVAPANTLAPALAVKLLTLIANNELATAPHGKLALMLRLPDVALQLNFTTIILVPAPDVTVKPLPLYDQV